ncbi:glycosyl transferase [Psychrobacter sp. 72-O-c]|uniref:glycosyl transferase n=1 Tax=Psychrobacter sp. 72-O-c TaxID=2774125 RepID=UPI00191A02C8|nr:glycosyl transferase [Psychrobacter sp. 72-O-c]
MPIDSKATNNKNIKQIICIKWGTKYGADYANKLYGMVSRNITPPFRFVCFTDDKTDVRSEIECQELPPLDITMPTNTLGKWPKSRLWGEKLGDLTGNVLFLDLDVIIVDSLDPFFEYGKPEDIVLSYNPSNPLERLGQTSCFRFQVGSLISLQEKFKADPQGIADEYRFEQRFVTRNAPGGVKLFPKAWVAHFRRKCRQPFPLNYFKTPKIPKGSRIIIFPGDLYPTDAISGRYNPNAANNIKDHLKRIKEPKNLKKPLRHLRHFILPVDWIEKYWKE